MVAKQESWMSKSISVIVDIKEEGQPDKRTRFIMDPDQRMSVEQTQQFEKVLDNSGNVVDFKKIGKPQLIVTGVIDQVIHTGPAFEE